MPSKFDQYLDNLSDKDKETLSKVEAKDVNDVTPPTPVPAQETNTNPQKLDENTAERLQGMKEVEGNNYMTQKDSLSTYPEKDNQEQAPQQEQEQER